ncbi:hypothetical protein DACRYDRAFT_109430 [Dacryopinax primogenitus]|uniref:Uncharacterized protein n=1 Tax=Dacryopinax primogenitus (strain DJM 731) TaxID=1858805 RepID=M5FRX4_DACPD|nr:uncharacterized protein DACRYDRAFT_109430 [Dacryopinax primogenitus]EJU00006.1 hypothetical protein DACRYDRAFT_109430 [Dacryopinax primogenitus]
MSLHFLWTRWDEDRQAGLADFLCENYCQALHIFPTMQLLVIKFQQQQNLTDEDFSRYICEEEEYFSCLVTEPEEDVLTFNYLEMLQSLAAAKSRLAELGFDGFINTTPETWYSGSNNMCQWALQ